jgi:release factor glutamine methyltransferase
MTHPQVYPPREDTFLLLEAALSEARAGERVLEVGTGSGFLASRLQNTCAVLATDINPYAVREARQAGVETARADLLQGIRGPFDLVVFNPPYLPTHPDDRISDWLEFALDGGKDGCEVIRRFSGQVGRVLAPGGRVLLVISTLTGLSRVRAFLEGCGFLTRVIRRQVLPGEILFVIRCERIE